MRERPRGALVRPHSRLPPPCGRFLDCFVYMWRPRDTPPSAWVLRPLPSLHTPTRPSKPGFSANTTACVLLTGLLRPGRFQARPPSPSTWSAALSPPLATIGVQAQRIKAPEGSGARVQPDTSYLSAPLEQNIAPPPHPAPKCIAGEK